MDQKIIEKLEGRLKHRREMVERYYNKNLSSMGQSNEYYNWYGKMEELESIIDMLKKEISKTD